MVIYHVTQTGITWSSEKPQDYLDRINILPEFQEKCNNVHILYRYMYVGTWFFFHIVENINIVKMIFPSKTRCLYFPPKLKPRLLTFSFKTKGLSAHISLQN